jgi:hypothetical protein
LGQAQWKQSISSLASSKLFQVIPPFEDTNFSSWRYFMLFGKKDAAREWALGPYSFLDIDLFYQGAMKNRNPGCIRDND